MIAPLQLPFPSLGAGTLVIGGIVFLIFLLGSVGAVLWYSRDGGDPWDDFADATAKIVDDEDADAIAFIPYSDGPLVPKPAIYDRELMGGKGGYRTPDGERIYVDGQGNGKFSLRGVDVILAMDPTEHAAAVDPLKAFVAHENDLGRWIKVDRKGNVIEAGEALTNVDGETPAFDDPDMKPTDTATPAADGGYETEVHKKSAEDGLTFEDAKEALEQAGELHKIVDLAPPREVNVDEETGEVEVEQATHVAIDVSEAANLLPKKTNTTAWQTMEEKARQEGMDEEKFKEWAITFTALGAILGGLIGVVMSVLFMFS